MTNKEAFLHENENYVVEATGPLETPYRLINKQTNVVEFQCADLAEMKGRAEQSNSYLKHEAWKWIDAQVKQQVEWAGLQFGEGAIAGAVSDETPPDGNSGSNLLN